MGDSLCIHLTGPFRVTSCDGRDFTPKGTKERALLLLLASQPSHVRARAWLQDKLWSDRGRDQGAASLRQALAQIRRTFGPFQEILQASRIDVQLDPDRVVTVSEAHGELAEGLDVRDQEFESWLTVERSARATQHGEVPETAPAVAKAPTTSTPSRLRAISITNVSEDWISSLIGDALALSLRELFARDVVCDTNTKTGNEEWGITVQTFQPGDQKIGVRIVVRHQPSARQIWSGHRIVEPGGAPPVEHPAVVQLVNETVEAIGDAAVLGSEIDLERQEDGDVLCRRGIRMVFSMEVEKVGKADRYFEKAHEVSGRGLCLAWQAQLRTIQRIERHRTDVDVLADEGAALASRALELEPNNSMVLAMLANSRLFLHSDPEGSLELATRSTAINPSNPMSWWAISSAQLYCGKTRTAYISAVRARHLARLSEHRFWWDLQQFASALGVGKLDEATELLESTAAQCPVFRPPFRYLVALYANAGKEGRAVKAADRLRELEPDFTIDRLLRDQNYPASLLHRTEALNLDRVAALG